MKKLGENLSKLLDIEDVPVNNQKITDSTAAATMNLNIGC